MSQLRVWDLSDKNQITVRIAPMGEVVLNISNLGSCAMTKESARKLIANLMEVSDFHED